MTSEGPAGMIRTMKPLLAFTAGLILASPALALDHLVVKATNPLPLARHSQTIEVSREALAPLGIDDLEKIRVKDASGKEVVSQSVDTDFDDLRLPDEIIFQTDFGPS